MAVESSTNVAAASRVNENRWVLMVATNECSSLLREGGEERRRASAEAHRIRLLNELKNDCMNQSQSQSNL